MLHLKRSLSTSASVFQPIMENVLNQILTERIVWRKAGLHKFIAENLSNKAVTASIFVESSESDGTRLYISHDSKTSVYEIPSPWLKNWIAKDQNPPQVRP